MLLLWEKIQQNLFFFIFSRQGNVNINKKLVFYYIFDNNNDYWFYPIILGIKIFMNCLFYIFFLIIAECLAIWLQVWPVQVYKKLKLKFW